MTKSLKQYGGVALIVIGAILLLSEYLKWLCGNWVLLAGLSCVIAGVCVHIYGIKRDGKY